MCVALTCGVQGAPPPEKVYHTPSECRTVYHTAYKTTYETTYETVCETTYKTKYVMQCDAPPEPPCSEHDDRKVCSAVGPDCYTVEQQVPRENCAEVPKKIPIRKKLEKVEEICK